MRLGRTRLTMAAGALSAVVALVGCQTPAPQTQGSAPSPQTSVQPPLEVGDQTPGVPAVPVAQHETWDPKPGRNADRQLDVAAPQPTVQLPAALGNDLSAYWKQEITWSSCEDSGQLNAQCATVKVPLDWENPGKAALDIVVTRVPSQNPQHGPLFLSPGGPGAGGTSMAWGFAEEGRGRGTELFPGYDLVGWDPRGTGKSTHVECDLSQQEDALINTDSSPDDDAERQALEESMAAYARGCREASGELLDHVSTIEAARDLDLLRFLLGAKKLNFYGASYGTELGAMYAELFPENTGRMVLDAAGDITGQSPVSMADGFELALRNYAAWCATQTSCSLGDSVEQVMAGIDTFLKGLDSQPIPAGEQTLNQNTAIMGGMSFLYAGAEGYPMLTEALQQGIGGDGTLLLQAAHDFLGLGADGWDGFTSSFYAIDCLDRSDQGLAGAYRAHEEQQRKTPVIASNAGLLQLACQVWTTDSVPDIKRQAKSAAPILVIGGTGDSASPYQHAVDMANQLESGHLLTFDGPGHVSFLRGSSCIDTAVQAFVADGTLPKEGTVCAED